MWIRLSGEFHLEIARIARNSVLTEMLDRLVAASSLMIGLYEPTNSAQCSNNEHLQLLELIRSGDALKASEFMDKHLEEIESRLLQPDDDDQEMDSPVCFQVDCFSPFSSHSLIFNPPFHGL